MANPRNPRQVRSGMLQVRVTLDEMTYVTEQAERLDTTLSEAVRAIIARSYLTDREAGATTAPSWIHPADDTLLDPEDYPEDYKSAEANADAEHAT